MVIASRRRIGQPVLDKSKKEIILQLARQGVSRRSAARVVGCAPSTITRTARCDPPFGADLALAEETLKLKALHAIRQAIGQDKYWRAAAWLLERLDPDRFARRPASVSLADSEGLLEAIGTILVEDLPEADRPRVAEKIATAFNELTEGENQFTADDFYLEGAQETEAEADGEPSPDATLPEEAACHPATARETGEPGVQHTPQTYYVPPPPPLNLNLLGAGASVASDCPFPGAETSGRCTDVSPAYGEAWPTTGRKHRAKRPKSLVS